MTLLELLKQELKEWPEGTASATQDRGGNIVFWGHNVTPTAYNIWYGEDEEGCCVEPLVDDVFLSSEGMERVASDYATAIITKEMWEND